VVNVLFHDYSMSMVWLIIHSSELVKLRLPTILELSHPFVVFLRIGNVHYKPDEIVAISYAAWRQ
jgi:hypothetical protein